MKSRTVSVVVFTDGKDVIIQERGSHSKVGEKYGLWGGKIAKGETKENAIKRELQEEIGYVPEILKYLGKYTYLVSEEGKYKGWKINQFVFTSPITPELKKAKVKEGGGIIKMPLDVASQGQGFPQGSTSFMSVLKK